MCGTKGLIVNVLTLVVWKCGNMRGTQGLTVNLLSLEVWKCGNVEICVELGV